MLHFVCIIYQNVHCEMLFISFHRGMLVWVHIDTLIIVARVLYDVDCCLVAELGDLSFSLHFVCASFELDVYMSFELHHSIFTVVQSMYFCESCGECIELVK